MLDFNEKQFKLYDFQNDFIFLVFSSQWPEHAVRLDWQPTILKFVCVLIGANS